MLSSGACSLIPALSKVFPAEVSLPCRWICCPSVRLEHTWILATPSFIRICSTGTTQSQPAGSMQPVITSIQWSEFFSVTSGAPAAWIASIGNVRLRSFHDWWWIAMPSIITRSNGGRSWSDVTSCLKNFPEALFIEVISTGLIAKWDWMSFSDSATEINLRIHWRKHTWHFLSIYAMVFVWVSFGIWKMCLNAPSVI